MKTVGLEVKERIIGEVKQSIQDSQGYFFVNFNKVKASAISKLRCVLKTSGAKLFVAKNSLFKRALDDAGRSDLNGFLAQETGIVFIYDKDIVRTAKALVDFSKENEIIQLRGGFIKEQKVSIDGLNVLAKLPPKEVLLGMAVSGLASVLTGFLSTLNQIMLKFVWVVEEIKKNKEQKSK
ncbi:MAG: 50S ribosomal protein L10 [Candidatus Omnitrophota bacterium]|nr:50S ribosomal protein L10 [Candidatus Omnitrophota bacterium]